ncbi:hypothetical protein KHC28_01050 [Ancylobacter sonchi]|uniref:hypothetical protein n=1 Tax=Ancylobacter sonchi TaxID=1937790 RepID=UPI001BD54D28|nr:hypothetical protein [Ancylobacter sonchi]MBS7532252.1 hypothetical protein [Ancylobacter sonchi]
MDVLWLDHLTMLSIAVLAAVLLIVVLRLFGIRHVRPVAERQLAGDGGYHYVVHPTDTHRAKIGRFSELAATASGYDCVAELVPETSKARDVRIHVVVEGATVGEIARMEVRSFMTAMGGQPARCDAVIVAHRETARGHSVRLDLDWPPRLS